jgi:hypothetical protein
MFLSRFLNITNFYIFWGIAAALIAVAWVRYLVEPKRSSASVGMTRLAALRALAMLSLGWYIVWMAVRGIRYLLAGSS